MESQIACCIARGGENVFGSCTVATAAQKAGDIRDGLHLGIVDTKALSNASGVVHAGCCGTGFGQPAPITFGNDLKPATVVIRLHDAT